MMKFHIKTNGEERSICGRARDHVEMLLKPKDFFNVRARTKSDDIESTCDVCSDIYSKEYPKNYNLLTTKNERI